MPRKRQRRLEEYARALHDLDGIQHFATPVVTAWKDVPEVQLMLTVIQQARKAIEAQIQAGVQRGELKSRDLAETPREALIQAQEGGAA